VGLKYLLDTNILSELSKQKPHSKVVKYVEKYAMQCTTAALVVTTNAIMSHSTS